MTSLIQKTCKGKSEIKLTIATYNNGDTSMKVYGANGEEVENRDYVYETGSITKTFTASLLAKYIHGGKMSLEDSIAKYVDGLNNNMYYPTLKRLATHTAGYRTHLPIAKKEYRKLAFEMIFKGCTNQGAFPFKMDLERMKQLLQEVKLADEDYPFQYSNLGIALFGYAIGVVSGEGYKATMQDFLINELGLQNTYTGTCPKKNLRGFTRNNKDIGNWVWGEDLTASAGDLSSTADDLLEYARINIEDEKPYLALCHQKHVAAKKFDVGLGWRLEKNNNHILWHPGGTGAFSSFLGIDKKKKQAAVVLSNYLINPERVGMAVLKNI